MHPKAPEDLSSILICAPLSHQPGPPPPHSPQKTQKAAQANQPLLQDPRRGRQISCLPPRARYLPESSGICRPRPYILPHPPQATHRTPQDGTDGGSPGWVSLGPSSLLDLEHFSSTHRGRPEVECSADEGCIWTEVGAVFQTCPMTNPKP